MTAAGAALLLGVLVLTAAPARAAAPASARLAWTGAPEGCPGAKALRAGVRERLGYDPFEPAAVLGVEVGVTARRRVLVGRVRLVEAETGRLLGERRVRGRAGRCEALLKALALAVSVALDPAAATRPHGPRRGRDLTAAGRRERRLRPARGAPAAVPAVARPAAPTRRAAWVVAAVPHIALGAAPAPAAGGSVGARWSRGWASVGAGARVDGPAARSEQGGRVRSGVLALELAGCAGSALVRGCALALAGGRHARGGGLQDARGTARPWAALGLRLALRWPTDAAWAAEARLDALAPLASVRLEVGEGTAWRSPPVAASVGVGVSWRPGPASASETP